MNLHILVITKLYYAHIFYEIRFCIIRSLSSLSLRVFKICIKGFRRRKMILNSKVGSMIK